MSFDISKAFERFCDSLKFSDNSIDSIRTRYHSITKRINLDYWNTTSDTAHSLYVGSYGRDTEISSSDIDMLVQLPFETYKKYKAYTYNGPSSLLQEVKKSISQTYSNTKLKADGQIISINFSDGINFEVLPAFENDDGSFIFPNSNDGGSWKVTNPRAEISSINIWNSICNHNLKRLCRMMRVWRDANNVDISGILIDILCYSFLTSWEYKDKSFLYYDWMTRDCLKYISEQPTTQYKWKVMGSGRYITCFGSFQNNAKQSYEIALDAIKYEKDYPYSANEKWRDIYGTSFPYAQS